MDTSRSASYIRIHEGLRGRIEKEIMDTLFIATVCGFFLLCWAFVHLCERV
jgi:hypothetical protein